jgi:glycosyltransferase involved in cell wall biosynthesis
MTWTQWGGSMFNLSIAPVYSMLPFPITVIIPTYKRPQLLRRALSSVASQSYLHLVIRVYDNASRDETEAVVREFMARDSRVEYVCQAENVGMMRNYQRALSEVQTPLFAILSDDDELLPGFYEEAIKGFERHPEIGFFAGSAVIANERGEVLRRPLDLWEREGLYAPEEAVVEMVGKYPVPMCIVFHRKVLALAIDETNALGWDCDFLMQIAQRFPVWISKRPSGIFLQHAGSYSFSQPLEVWRDSIEKLIDRVRLSGLPSAEVAGRVVERLCADRMAVTRAFCVDYLKRRRFAEAERAVSYLKEGRGLSSEVLLLACLARGGSYVPFLSSLLGIAQKVKRLLR